MSTESTQYDKQWWLDRRGRVTASRCENMIFGSYSQWVKLIAQLNAERSSPMPENLNKGNGKAAQWGLDTEEKCIKLYAFENAVEISRPSFVKHPSYDYAGCSPDFFENDDVVGEVKCPYKIENFYSRVMNPFNRQEFCQVQYQLWCCPDRDRGVYLVYHPDVSDPSKRLYKRPVEREPQFQSRITERYEEFVEFMTSGREAPKTKVFF